MYYYIKSVLLVIFFAISFILLTAAFIWPGSRVLADSQVRFNDTGSFLIISNNKFEISFNNSNGGIDYIKDNLTGKDVINGSNRDMLWWAFLGDGDWVESSSYINNFKYKWNPENSLLTLYYPGDERNRLDVTVKIGFSEGKFLKMDGEVINRGNAAVQSFALPFNLQVNTDIIDDAVIPLLPGVILDRAFFEDSRSYTAQYPGVLFADFLGLRSSSGNIALYSQKHESLQPVYTGFEKSNDDSSYNLVHNFKTWIEPDTSWYSPCIYIRVGEDYQESAAAYRRDSGIANFPGIEEKLGEESRQYFQSPLYKLDLELIGQSFDKLKSRVIDTIDIPGIVHPVAFQKGGHDLNYPDFLPPAEDIGSTTDFREFVEYIREQGNLVIPYTNFSWWDIDGPTLSALSDGSNADNTTVIKNGGAGLVESYGEGKDGYVMNLHNSFVKKRIAEEHDKLKNTVKMDGIFEDQWGARSAPYDFNPAGLDRYDPAVSYFEGVLNHMQNHGDNNLMTELGVDMLAEYQIGFMGTNYLWDLLGYRPTTAEYSHYYPLAGMLLRDKVLLYQHDLAEETWTDNRDMFRWNLAMGYNFSNAFYVNDALYTENPWLDLTGVFQKYVLSNYADQLVKEYKDTGNGVYKTRFSDYTVYSNWNTVNTFKLKGHVIPPGGAVVTADDNTVTAGLFRTFNNRLLAEGEHYLVQLRNADNIKIFQPVGKDTPLAIKKNPDWPGVSIKAYRYNGEFIADVKGRADGDYIGFDYQNEISSQEVGYYELTRSDTPVPGIELKDLKPDLVVKDIITEPVKPVAGDEVTLYVIIENKGEGASPAGFVHDINLNINAKQEVFWAKTFSESIAPGANVTVKISGGLDGAVWSAPAGEHVVQVMVDNYNKINESNEDNNEYIKLLPLIEEQDIKATSEKPVNKKIDVIKTDLDLTVDSDLERAFDLYLSSEIDRVVVGLADSKDDIRGEFGLLWDNENLYLLADITDDIKKTNQAQSAWQNDSVELYLDMYNNGGSTYMKDDFQFMFCWNNDRPYETKHNSVAGVRTGCFDTGKGYRIFAAVPWETLAVTPSPDMKFGLDLAVNDNDSGIRDTQLIWNSYDEQAWQYPNRFGSGKLVKGE